MHDYVTNSISFAFARAQETGLLIVQWLILRVSVRRVSVGRMMWPTTPASLTRLSQAFFPLIFILLAPFIFSFLPFCIHFYLLALLSFLLLLLRWIMLHFNFPVLDFYAQYYSCLMVFAAIFCIFVSVNGRNNHDWNICIPHSVIIIILKNVDVTVVFFMKTNKNRIH